ncbi:MAG: ABC transporter permease [Gemmatimonadetes bacterium]|nr:ABC transporter permease [Gemmatimonadota bacterium]MBI3504333.1 ABC transporter permease [Pseudomonadota bacterium]
MVKLWVVIKREYMEKVRSKWFIISTIFGPVFFAAITILPSYMSMRGMKNAQVSDIRILDATGAGMGQRVADRLKAQREEVVKRLPGGMGEAAIKATPTTVLSVEPAKLAEAESVATRLVMAKGSQGYLVLDSLTLTEKKARYAGRNASSIQEMELLQNAVSSAFLASRLEAAGIPAARIDSLTKSRVNVSAERIDEKGRGGSGLVSAIFGFVIAFLLYMMIILYGQNVLRGVLEEKTTRVAEVVMSSVKPDILLAGKVIGVGAVGLTQQLVWFGSAALLMAYGAQMATAMGMPNMSAIVFPSVSPLLGVSLVLFFLLGYTFYSALFAAVGAMVGSQEEAQQAAQPVMMLLVASIIMVQPIMFNPSGTLAVTMSLLPFSAPIIMPLRMSATQVPMTEVAGSLIGLAIACWAAIWVSARIYRVGLLMTGKRPSLKELVKWVRYA